MTEATNIDFVVADGVRFLESLGRAFGAERAMEMWEEMGQAIGPDIRAQVFMAMLTGSGGTGTRVRVRRGACTQAVPAIKSIRTATGFGLKEAKDIWDKSLDEQAIVECSTSQQAHKLGAELRSLGMLVC